MPVRSALPSVVAGALVVAACRAQGPDLDDASFVRPTDTAADVPRVDAPRDTGSMDAAPPREASTPDVAPPRDTFAPPRDAAAPDVGPCTPGTPASQLRTHTVSVAPRAVSTGSPVMAAPLPSGGAVVAWSTGEEVVLTVTDGWGTRVGADLAVAGREAMGVAVAPDGYALLVTRGTDQLHFVKVSPAGAVLAERALLAGGNHATVGTEWYGEFANTGRLVTTPTGFAAYFGLHRRWPDGIGHQGDTLRLLGPDGAPQGGGWDWGCSHSLDLRLAVQGETLAPVCLSDCYPTKGILFHHRGPVISDEPSGNCAGGSSARLGAIVPAAGGGYWVTYTSAEGRGSSDVALAALAPSGMVTARTWLTANATPETEARLAPFEGGLLAGWEAGGTRYLARVARDGTVTGAPAAAGVAFARQGDFFAYPGGDVGWAWGAGDGLHLARVRACR